MLEIANVGVITIYTNRENLMSLIKEMKSLDKETIDILIEYVFFLRLQVINPTLVKLKNHKGEVYYWLKLSKTPCKCEDLYIDELTGNIINGKFEHIFNLKEYLFNLDKKCDVCRK